MVTVQALADATRVRTGKVRDVYAVGDDLLLVASDRISAYDVVLPSIIPDKGKVLTGLSDYWFRELADVVGNHRITTDPRAFPDALSPAADELRGRAMLCRRAQVLPIECVARGFLAGSAWKEYQASGTACGVRLPAGLVEAARLPEPIFTPAAKAEHGHDENITFDDVVAAIGAAKARRLRELTLQLYRRISDHAGDRGILLADTKFEFGLIDGEVALVDEVGTPDSSRLWPADGYEPGHAQPSFDKQYVRDWLTSSGWDRTPPAPPLPDDVVSRTRGRYITAYERLTGSRFEAWATEGTG